MKAETYNKMYDVLIKKLRQLSTKKTKEEIITFIEEELNYSSPVELRSRIIKVKKYKSLTEEEITKLEKIYNMYKKQSTDKTRTSYKNSNTYNIKYAGLIEKLRKLSTKETKEEIITFIEKELNYSSPVELRNRIIKMKKYNSLAEEEIIRLEKIYNIYKNKKTETKEKNKHSITEKNEEYDIEAAKTKEIILMASLMEEFIESGQTKKEFKVKNNISTSTFEKMERYIKKSYPELYSYYQSYLYCQEMELKGIIETTLPLILDSLKNGILENGVKRNFDIIDFYSIVKTNIRVDEYYQRAKKYHFLNNIDEQALYCKFLSKYVDKALNSEEIITYLDGYTEVNSKKNKYGLPIIGTGRVITEEEKIEMISFLKSNNIPITNNSLRDITTRYLNNDQNKIKQLTK